MHWLESVQDQSMFLMIAPECILSIVSMQLVFFLVGVCVCGGGGLAHIITSFFNVFVIIIILSLRLQSTWWCITMAPSHFSGKTSLRVFQIASCSLLQYLLLDYQVYMRFLPGSVADNSHRFPWGTPQRLGPTMVSHTSGWKRSLPTHKLTCVGLLWPSTHGTLSFNWQLTQLFLGLPLSFWSFIPVD